MLLWLLQEWHWGPLMATPLLLLPHCHRLFSFLLITSSATLLMVKIKSGREKTTPEKTLLGEML
jgi:hypothetical protein